MGERSNDDPVRLCAYDAAWVTAFGHEAVVLGEVLGPWLTGGVHHVGSTAVPGLVAKPIIDIMAGVGDLESSRDAIEKLGGLGYCYAPYRADVMHWFCKPSPSRRTHHLHLVPTGSARFTDVLAFRDYLRAHPAAAADYAELKQRLAARHADDRDAYTDGKAAMVAAISADARRWVATD